MISQYIYDQCYKMCIEAGVPISLAETAASLCESKYNRNEYTRKPGDLITATVKETVASHKKIVNKEKKNANAKAKK
jgi:hypothetical protein